MNFDFIHHSNLRDIIVRDFKELEICIQYEASKSALILTGSIIECILMDYFSNNLPPNKTLNQVHKLRLNDLIQMATDEQLISQKEKDLSSVIRNYRNLIHPGVEVRKNETINVDVAQISFSLLKLVVSKIETNYQNRYKYKASDIINKIKSDPNTIEIFDELVDQLSKGQQEVLFDLLINFESNISKLNQYIDKLKAYTSDEFIGNKLLELVTKIETSKEVDVVHLFNFLKDEIHLLEGLKKEKVQKYMIGVLGSIKTNSYCRAFVSNKTFENFYFNILNEELKIRFKKNALNFFLLSIWAYQNDNIVKEFSQQLISDSSEKEEIKEKLLLMNTEERLKLIDKNYPHWHDGYTGKTYR